MNEEVTTPSTEEASPGRTPLLGEEAPKEGQKVEATAPKEGEKPKEGEAPKEGVKPETPKAPIKYELKLPEKSVLDASHLEKVAAFAQARGFSQEDAQALVNSNHELAAQAVADYAKSHEPNGKEWNRLYDEYQDLAMKDKEIGGSIENLKKHAELARRVIERFDTEGQLHSMMNTSPIGNHPAVIKALAKIGKAMSDDSFVG
jgi:hypothetical protein